MFGKKVYFFGGKGGVGKTTVSSAFSLILSRKGRRVLIISTDPAHSLSDIFGVDIGGDLKEVVPGLVATEIDPKEEIKSHIEMALKTVERVVSPEVLDQIREVFRSVEHTPGVEEAAVVDALSRRITDGWKDFDCFVVDTAPTGHSLAMLKTVSRIGKWMEEVLERKLRAEEFKKIAGIGEGTPEALRTLRERRERLGRFSEIILSDETVFIPVLNPEKLSVLETERLVRDLKSIGIDVPCLIVNKVIPKGVGGEFLERRRSQERVYLQMIEERFADVRRIILEMRPTDVKGLEDLKDLASELEVNIDDRRG